MRMMDGIMETTFDEPIAQQFPVLDCFSMRHMGSMALSAPMLEDSMSAIRSRLESINEA